MGWDGLVAARNVLAKHKVAGSTPVTRSHELGLRRGGGWRRIKSGGGAARISCPGKWRS